MFARACFGCFAAKDYAQSQSPISAKKSLEEPLTLMSVNGLINRPVRDGITDCAIFIRLPSSAAPHQQSSSCPQQPLDDDLFWPLNADQVPASLMACQLADAFLNSSLSSPDTGASTGTAIPAGAIISPVPAVTLTRGGQKSESSDGAFTEPSTATPAATMVAKAEQEEAGGTAPLVMPVMGAAPPSQALMPVLGGRPIGVSRSSGGKGKLARQGSTGSLPRPLLMRATSGPVNPYLWGALSRRAGSGASMAPRRQKSGGEQFANMAGIVQGFTRGRSLSVAVAERRAASECLARGVLPPGIGLEISSISRVSEFGSDLLISLRAHQQKGLGAGRAKSTPALGAAV